MTSTERRRSRCLPRIRLGAMVSIVALGVLLIPMLTAARPGQAPQTGPSYQVLHAFTGGADGAWPYAGVILDSAGNIYGATNQGGAYDKGVVFEIGPTGQETVLYSFTGGADGSEPFGGLIRDAAGNLYGTTGGGGAYDSGTVFEISATGQETVLYSFAGGVDGKDPTGSLFRGPAGSLYGTTYVGGDMSECYSSGCGVVFEVTPEGQERVLYTFTGGADGGSPQSGVIPDSTGNLYGTAEEYGAYGYGVVFQLSPTGQETILHAFTRGGDGAYPSAGLTRGTAGNLYGTATGGGANNLGVVFEMSPTGEETVLYSFPGNAAGAEPWAGLLRTSSGNLYGTTIGGGDLNDCLGKGCGTVFRLSPTGQETVLYRFGGADGEEPFWAGVVEDKAGNLYGATNSGGDMSGCSGYGCGVVFKIAP